MVDEPEKTAPLILAIETATRSGGVAVARGDMLLAHREGDASVSHSANLIEMIQTVLAEADAELADIDLFAVAVGPGSFTGLRIGLATVKAFAACNQKPIAAVATLAAVAHAAGRDGTIVASLPGGRGEVFAQLFKVSDGVCSPGDDAAHLRPTDVVARYGKIDNLSWAGEGKQKIDEFLEQPKIGSGDLAREGPSQTAGEAAERLAPSVAALAFQLYLAGQTIEAERLKAVYVRASDAELNERWQQANPQSRA